MQIESKNYKVIIVGSSRSGKTSLLNRLFNHSQQQNYIPTLSLETKSKYLEIQGISINLEIIDTPGSSQYELLRRSNYKGCQAIVFVFDITNDQSFDFLSQEIELIVEKQLCSYDTSGVLIGINPGGKYRKVILQEAENIGNIIGSYYEISINDKYKINSIFYNIAEERLKFDGQDVSIKSMLEKIHQNIENPSCSQLKKKFENSNQEVQAAPGENCQEEADLKTKNQKTLKFLLIGESSVGKTAIFQNYIYKDFVYSFQPTIGVDFGVVNKSIDEQNYRLQFWDTAGLHKFKPITEAYYKGAHVVFCVYDITNQETLNLAKHLIKEFDKANGKTVKYRCLVGNKSDLPRSVSTQVGMAVAQQLKSDFAEISAKNQQDLQNLFMKALMHVHQKSKK